MKYFALVIIALVTLNVAAKSFIDFKSIIHHVNDLKTTWTAGVNKKFENMDLQTIKGMMGSLETPEHLKLPLKHIEPLKDIPEEFSSA